MSVTERQNLHHMEYGELQKRPVWQRKQALFEWMIEPLFTSGLKGENVYPFPVGQSEADSIKMVDELDRALGDLKLNKGDHWYTLSPIRTVIQLTEPSHTKDYFIRQQFTAKTNLALIKERFNCPSPTHLINQILGSFGADPLQEYDQRQEVAWNLLNGEIRFFQEAPAKAEETDSIQCPFDLSGLSTVEQRERFMFVFLKQPTFSAIKGKFKTIKTSQAWQSALNKINNHLTDCEIVFNRAKNLYEVVKLSS